MKENSIINKQAAEQIVVESLKKRKCIERVEVSTVEQKNEIWVVRGTCPIDMEGHPWAEKFEVTVDTRGRIKSIDLALL
jgi:transcriptional regulatory protein LevR